MDIYSKRPDFSGRKIPIFIIVLSISVSGLLIFDLFPQKSEADLLSENFSIFSDQERIVFLEKNTLIPNSSPENPEPRVVNKLPVIVTAYSSTTWETDSDPYVTAAGTWVRDGIIANNLLPFGTKVRLPEIYGDKIFIVEDRMSWKKGNYQIDIWFPSYWEAKEFGAKRTYVEILEN
jgi:3D (Asp-Asp-Asp) domain-containing protein